MQSSNPSSLDIPDCSEFSLRVGVVVSAFHSEITERLAEGAREILRHANIPDAQQTWMRVAGAFELPIAAQALITRAKAEIVIALGCVIRGDTPHFDHVCRAAVDGLQRVALDTQIPVGLGVLTVDNLDQAQIRSGSGSQNVGASAAVAALTTWYALRQLE